MGPAPLLALAVLAGARAGAALSEVAGADGGLVAGGLAATGLASAVTAGMVRGRGRRIVLAVAAALLVGAGLSAARVALVSDTPLTALARDGGAAEVAVVVDAEPRPAHGGGWWALVRVTRVGGVQVRQRALLRDDGPIRAVGTRLAGTATARPVEDDRFGDYLRGRHVAVAVDPVALSQVAPPGRLHGAIEAIRHRIRAGATRHLGAAEAGLAVGLVTGDTRLLPAAVEADMRATGLTHLVAVSGSNVAVVTAGTVLLVGLLGIGARGRRRAVAVTILAFTLLTRADPSVLRAAVMAGVVLLALGRGVRRDPRHDLGAAVLLLVLADPLLARSPGLLLSAGAAAGVLVLAPLVRRRLQWLPDPLGGVVAVTVGAQLAVAPLLLVMQGAVPLASVPANVLAVPAAVVASALAGVAAVVSVVDPALGGVAFLPAVPPAAVVIRVAEQFSGAGGVLTAARPVALALAAAVAAWLLARPGGRGSRALAGTALVLAVAVLLPRLVPPVPVRGLTVTAIDVGQGDAILVEAPGVRVLVDGGPDDRAARWLASRRRRDLDVVVLSHPHADHVAGLPTVLRQGRIGAYWHRPVGAPPPPARDALAAAAEAGAAIAEPAAGERLRVGELLVEVLGPPPGRPYAGGDAEANDMSVVLRIVWRGRAVLLAGDAEHAAQQDLLAAGADVRAGVLKVPHHGGATSEPEFLAAVDASVALVSAGRGNPYGHPHPAVLAELARLGVDVRRTDEEGTVSVTVPATGPELAAAGTRPPIGSAWLRSRHASTGHPHQRRRRPAPPSRDPAGRRGPPLRARRRGGARARDLRRRRDRAPPRDADRLAVRGADLCRAAGCGGVERRPQGRGRGLPRRPEPRRGPADRGAGHEPDPQDLLARRGGG